MVVDVRHWFLTQNRDRIEINPARGCDRAHVSFCVFRRRVEAVDRRISGCLRFDDRPDGSDDLAGEGGPRIDDPTLLRRQCHGVSGRIT